MILLTPTDSSRIDKPFLLDPNQIKAIVPRDEDTHITTHSDLSYAVIETRDEVVCLKMLWNHRSEMEHRKPGCPILFVGMNEQQRPTWAYAPNFFDTPQIDG